MNGRNMVLPKRDGVEKWAADRAKIEPSLVRHQRHLNLCCPPVGILLCVNPCVCVCVRKILSQACNTVWEVLPTQNPMFYSNLHVNALIS